MSGCLIQKILRNAPDPKEVREAEILQSIRTTFAEKALMVPRCRIWPALRG